MPVGDKCLGSAMIGEKVTINQQSVAVTKLLGEGGFAFVYLVKEIAEHEKSGSIGNGTSTKRSATRSGSKSGSEDNPAPEKYMVLKVTSILSRQQRDIAEKEAKLLARLSHPSIVKMHDHCYRTLQSNREAKSKAQHLILMEYCEGGHAMNVCAKLVEQGEHFDLSTLIIAFGQICNAVSYLHAQRPPIVHRDLKPENFLIKNGAYKLCDFGSAVFGHIELKTSKDRADAEEVIEKTTTQMFRAPEMVDLYMAKKLTQATDVWALGCCLYSLSFLKNCFEEGSNLAILSRKYKIPDDNPYGDGLAELIDRMLDSDSKSRADMTEVILCLSAVYSGKPLPPRKERKKEKKDEKKKTKKEPRAGTYRTDGQGIQEDLTIDLKKSPKEAKKLDPNSAAARRRQAAGGDLDFATLHSKFDEEKKRKDNVNQDLAFSTTDNPFASLEASHGSSNSASMFANFNDSADTSNAFEWDNGGDFGRGRSMDDGTKKPRSRSQDHRRRRKDTKDEHKDETTEEAMDRLANDEDAAALAAEVNKDKKRPSSRSRTVRRVVSGSSTHQRSSRSLSRGAGLRRSKSGRMNRKREEKQEEQDASESSGSSASASD